MNRLRDRVSNAIGSDHWLSAVYEEYESFSYGRKYKALVYCLGRQNPVLEVNTNNCHSGLSVQMFDRSFQWIAERL